MRISLTPSCYQSHSQAKPVMDRRQFVGGLSSLALAVAGLAAGHKAWGRPRFRAYPFSLGVASGDPLPAGVVLWTRLAPDPLRGGGMPPENVEVDWWVATDERMTNVVRRGTTVAEPDLAHSVHVEVNGLEPARWYWYQFRAGAEVSPIGRTRTTPLARAAVDRLSFAFASCQHYEHGYFTAFRHMAAEDLDLVIHLGDYIYEYQGRQDRVRMHTGSEIETLPDYRNRYALYKTDPDLQAAHAAFPWVVTPDDHEVENDYAAAISERADPIDAFLTRRANGYQAYYEHMPLRRGSIPRGPDMQLFRRSSFGTLAEFFVLDTRQYRTDQPCGGRNGPLCPGVFDANATLMGQEQEQWLRDGLDNSSARWNVLAQQIMVARVDQVPGAEVRYSMDQWSGYEAARNRLLGYLLERQPSNPIVLTGNVHSNWVNDLKIDFSDATSATVATEFVGTSISSEGDGVASRPQTAEILAENPFVKYWNGQRGYVRCRVTPELWTSDYRIVQYVTQPDGPIHTGASFVVENGKPGAERA